MNFKITDVHAHFFPDALAERAVDNLGKYYSYTMHGKGTFADLMKSADDAGIARLVIHSTALKPTQVEVINDSTASHISENVAGFGTLHQDYEGNFEKEIKRIKSLGLKGIKLHPDFQMFNTDDKKMYPVYDIIRSEGLPILFHVGDRKSDFSAPRRLAKVIEDFPGLKIIAAHLGGYDVWGEAEEYVLGKDVYIDTSSCFRRISYDRIRSLIGKHDIDKVMFGTDYPIERHDYCVENFLKLGFNDDELEKIFYTNADRLIFGGEGK